MILPENLQSPASISKGASTITTFSPLSQYTSSFQASRRRMAGWMIALSCFRLFSSLKMIWPSFGLSNVPCSEDTMSLPKCCCSLRSVRVPGSTTSRARMSRSIKGRAWSGDWNRRETVDLPEAIPPVKPTTSILGWRKGQLRRCCSGWCIEEACSQRHGTLFVAIQIFHWTSRIPTTSANA